jgi:hypothetical protein
LGEEGEGGALLAGSKSTKGEGRVRRQKEEEREMGELTYLHVLPNPMPLRTSR